MISLEILKKSGIRIPLLNGKDQFVTAGVHTAKNIISHNWCFEEIHFAFQGLGRVMPHLNDTFSSSNTSVQSSPSVLGRLRDRGSEDSTGGSGVTVLKSS